MLAKSKSEVINHQREGGQWEFMALDIKVHRPHHVRNEGEQKREKSNFLVLEPINPELFASYLVLVALSLTREFIATADATLASLRAGLFVGDENGCSILARPGAAWRPKPHGWSVVAGKVPIVPGHGRTELCIVAELCKPLQDLPRACPGVQGETMLPSIHMQHLRLQTPVKKGLKSCRKKPEGEWEQAFLPGP